MIRRNALHGEAQGDGSFCGLLVDQGLYDARALAELEAELVQASCRPALASELDPLVFTIFRTLAFHLGFHTDPRDVYRIDNLADDDVGDLRNRVGWVFERYFERSLDAVALAGLPPAPQALQGVPADRGLGRPVAEGDVLRVVRPLAALVLTHWRSPTTGSFDVVLHPPAELRVLSLSGQDTILATCEPLAPAARRDLVPWWIRWHPLYGGFSLCIPADDLGERCRPQDRNPGDG